VDLTTFLLIMQVNEKLAGDLLTVRAGDADPGSRFKEEKKRFRPSAY